MPPRIRLATGADAAAMHAIYAPIVAETHISFEWAPPGVAEIRGRIDEGLAGGHPWLVYEDGGAVIAVAYASRHRARAAYRWSAETSIYVSEAARGRGIGRMLYRALLRVLALQGYRGAFAGIALPNPASVALHRALGFEEIGVFRRIGYKAGAWRDVLWLQLPLGDESPPREPLPLAAAMRLPAWAGALAADLQPGE